VGNRNAPFARPLLFRAYEEAAQYARNSYADLCTYPGVARLTELAGFSRCELRGHARLTALWIWVIALRGSLPFAITLPILVATVFATIADWVEDYLVRHRPKQDQSDDAVWDRRSDGAPRRLGRLRPRTPQWRTRLTAL
jgi:hypothetical protein